MCLFFLVRPVCTCLRTSAFAMQYNKLRCYAPWQTAMSTSHAHLKYYVLECALLCGSEQSVRNSVAIEFTQKAKRHDTGRVSSAP